MTTALGGRRLSAPLQTTGKRSFQMAEKQSELTEINEEQYRSLMRRLEVKLNKLPRRSLLRTRRADEIFDRTIISQNPKIKKAGIYLMRTV